MIDDLRRVELAVREFPDSGIAEIALHGAYFGRSFEQSEPFRVTGCGAV